MTECDVYAALCSSLDVVYAKSHCDDMNESNDYDWNLQRPVFEIKQLITAIHTGSFCKWVS
jgi:hypothetical protein